MPTSTPANSAPLLTTTRVLTASYDGLGRLITVREQPGTFFRYDYDLAGNRTEVWENGEQTAARSYDAANQVLGWQYDAAGNLLSDGVSRWNYDALGRMIGVAKGQQSRTYSYNGAGVLVAQTSAGSTTRYVQDLAAPLSQVLQIQQGASTMRVVYGQERLFSTQGGARAWYATDGLGSVRQTWDDGAWPGASVWYDPWGQVEQGPVPTFGFTGELHDAELGQIHLRARWYAPAHGSLLGRDPHPGQVGDPLSQQPYLYGRNNPFSYSDPSGRTAIPLPNDPGAVMGMLAAAAAAGGAAAGAAIACIATVVCGLVVAGTAIEVYVFAISPNQEAYRADLVRGADYVWNLGQGYTWVGAPLPLHTGHGAPPPVVGLPPGTSQRTQQPNEHVLSNPLPTEEECRLPGFDTGEAWPFPLVNPGPQALAPQRGPYISPFDPTVEEALQLMENGTPTAQFLAGLIRSGQIEPAVLSGADFWNTYGARRGLPSDIPWYAVQAMYGGVAGFPHGRQAVVPAELSTEEIAVRLLHEALHVYQLEIEQNPALLNSLQAREIQAYHAEEVFREYLGMEPEHGSLEAIKRYVRENYYDGP